LVGKAPFDALVKAASFDALVKALPVEIGAFVHVARLTY